MASKKYTFARALLMVLGMALVAACGAKAPVRTAALGELAVEWLPPSAGTDAPVSLEVEVRSVSGAAAIRRQLVLGDGQGLEARLALPPGVYSVQLRSAVLPPGAAHLAAAQHAHLPAPPPHIVLIAAAGTTRAQVALAAAELGERASLSPAL